jgi:hypothetical protein
MLPAFKNEKKAEKPEIQGSMPYVVPINKNEEIQHVIGYFLENHSYILCPCCCCSILVNFEDNRPWADLFCPFCYQLFEMKASKYKNNTELELSGGSYKMFIDLEIKPILIVIIYDTSEYSKDKYIVSIKDVNFYTGYQYMVMSNLSSTKSIIKCLNPFTYINLPDNVNFEIDYEKSRDCNNINQIFYGSRRICIQYYSKKINFLLR